MVFHGTRLVFHRAERRRREARHETYITPKLDTTRRSILGPPAEGRPGPSDDNGGGGECDDVDGVMRMTMMLMIMLVSTSAKLFPITHLSLLTHLEQKKSQKSYDWAPFTKLISLLGTHLALQNNLMI